MNKPKADPPAIAEYKRTVALVAAMLWPVYKAQQYTMADTIEIAINWVDAVDTTVDKQLEQAGHKVGL